MHEPLQLSLPIEELHEPIPLPPQVAEEVVEILGSLLLQIYGLETRKEPAHDS